MHPVYGLEMPPKRPPRDEGMAIGVLRVGEDWGSILERCEEKKNNSFGDDAIY